MDNYGKSYNSNSNSNSNSRDELSIALQQMQSNLQKVSEEHAERTWLQTGKNSLSERLRGEKSLPEVAKEIVDFLAVYVTVQIGTVYILEEDKFNLQYAYGTKSDLTMSFTLGDGMVGQVAVKKSLTVFDNVPKNYFQVKSSLGRQIPDSIAILPIVFNDKSIAVIELAKVGAFTPIQLKLLEEVSENIAISVNTSLNQESLKELLDKLQLQKSDMEKTALELAKQVECLNNAAIVSIADANGDIIYVNDKFCEISKYSREELMGQNHRIVKSGKQPEGLFVGMWKLISSGRVWNGEILNKAKDDSYYWVDTTITPFKGLDGKIEKYVAIRFDITNTKNQKTEIELITEELSKQIECLNNAAIVSIADAKGDIIYVNDKFCEISKYSREELMGQNHRIVKSGRQPDGLFVGMWKLISQGKVWNGEILNRAKDGSFYWVDTTITPFKGFDGKIEKYVAIRFDITAAKNQKEEIETVTSELTRQVECLNNAAIVSIADDKGDIIYVNDKFCEISKYSREELMGQNHRLLKSGRQPEGLFVGMWKLISMGKVWNGEILNKAKDDTYYWVDTTITPFKGKDGQIEKYVAIRFDITNTKNQKNEIEAITTAIYKSNMAVEFDLNGVVLRSNDIFRDVMGYQDENEIIGKHDSIFLEKGSENHEDYHTLWTNLRKGEFQEFEYKRITKSGEEVWIKGNYNPIFDTQGKPYKILKIATDITLAKKQALDLELQAQMLQRQQDEMRRANEELDKKTKQLEISSKYKSEFLSNMSHELRTPLNSLLILAKDLADNKNNNLDNDQVESSGIIYKSGQDLLMLINEVLDLSKIEAGKMTLNVEPLFVKELCNSLRLNFKHHTDKKGIALDITIDNDVPPVIKTDALRLNQILKNLLSNAIKFTDNGGISVRVSVDSPGRIRIDVTDSGIGIAKEKQMLIFEAFQQADGSTARKYGGTGLGLSISRDLVKLLEGELSLRSDVGEGSTFTVTLPFELETENTGTPQPQISLPIMYKRMENNNRSLNSPAMDDDRHTLTVDDKVLLIIEDDLPFAGVLRKQAVKKGYKCLLAATGEDGLEMAEKYHPKAIMLDIELPGISGHQVLAELKGNPAMRHIPVHIISSQDSAIGAMKEGALDVSMKPVNKLELEKTFDRIDGFLERKMKNLLIVEDNKELRRSIRILIEDEDVNCIEAETGKETISIVKNKDIDCMILDMGLPDMNGYDVIQAIRKIKNKKAPPIIIYTGRELDATETAKLQKHASSIIIKGVKSEERLLDEASMFLHRTISNLHPSKQEIITKLYNKDLIFNNKKVLVVDDDMRNVFALSKKLRELGMHIEKADNGITALEMLKKHKDFDMILMDIMMPEMDGYETMKHIRAKGDYQDIPIIALTAKAMKEDEQKCLAAGANAYISKPVDITSLYTMMRVYMTKESVLA
jgi:PAS domain S-box-containing protein